MKTKINFLTITVLSLVCMLFFMVVGCGKKDDIYRTEKECLWVSSFFEGVSMHSNDNDTYIIKGIVLGKIEDGLNIRLVEDLKGNFPKKNNFFIALGYLPIAPFYLRVDYLNSYDKQDVLIMHLTRTNIPLSDCYATFECNHSVVKLSDGYVTGHILQYEGGLWEYEIGLRKEMSQEELRSYAEISQLRAQQNIIDTIPLDDFQKKLNELLN